jgi:hypothetical protein
MSLADNLAANAADCVKAVHAADNGEPSIPRQEAGEDFVGIGVPLRRAISADLAGKTARVAQSRNRFASVAFLL